MRISHLDRLNTEQWQAVEHGVGKANGSEEDRFASSLAPAPAIRARSRVASRI
jgi:hypothetical protein